MKAESSTPCIVEQTGRTFGTFSRIGTYLKLGVECGT
jgi:hypothetical protein